MRQPDLSQPSVGHRVAVSFILVLVLFLPVQLIVGVALAVVSGTEQVGNLVGAVAVLFPTFAAVSLLGAVVYVLAIEAYERLIRPASMLTSVAFSPFLLAGFPVLGLHHALLPWNWLVASAVSTLAFGVAAFKFTRRRTT